MAASYTILFLTLALLTSLTHSLECTKQNLTNNNFYKKCMDLPYLQAYLHWTYDQTKSSLSIAFVAPPSKSDGWISWAINPTGTEMVGSQSLIAFKLPNGSMTVQTFNITSYASISQSKIAYDVSGAMAEHVGGVMTLYATLALPPKTTVVNQVWQVGGSVSGGVPQKHAFGTANLNALGPLDLTKGTKKSDGSSGPTASPANSPASAPEMTNAPPTQSLVCTKQNLTNNFVYQKCVDLPYLQAYLHWTYDQTKSSLSIAYIAPPSKSDGWISWAINPTGTEMVGSQALIAFKLPNGSMTVQTFNITSYGSISQSKIAYNVTGTKAELVGGVMTLYATLALPPKLTVVNQVWQVGGAVAGGVPQKHDLAPANLNALGLLDLIKGTSKSDGSDGPEASPTNSPAPGNSKAPQTKESAPSGVSSIRSIGLPSLVLLFIASLL